jgi:hypothetical protein
MANTVTLSPDIKGSKLVGAIVAIDTYAAGGVALGVSQTGMRQIDGVGILGVTGRNVRAAYISGKIVLYGIKPESVVYPYVGAALSANDIAGTTDYANFGANRAAYVTLVAGTTLNMTIAAQPKVPCNVRIAQSNAAGANPANSTATVYTVTGTFNGKAQIETITIPAAVSLATNKGLVVGGLKPFDTITSIVATAAPTTGFSHAAGPGTILGLPTAPANGVYTDVKLITRLGNIITPVTGAPPGAGRLNASLDGVDVGDITANDDILVKYLGVGQAQEIPDGTLSPAAVVACLVAGF